ncbi:Glutamine-rich protein 2 [Mytilus coruscus]|uniref:Glutamine-rich protein 2 n=1 Tax=Mytilus coruscus TaxID=42192 RepID=A0A6J8D3A0_MYTCO|nr:Glutamine-rich protein 2 [Mytilus coruscus]
MPSTKVNLSQMVDLALGSPEVGSVNFNVLHTLLHAMLKRLNIVDVQADINEFDRDFLSASKARELSVLSDVDSGRGEDAEDTLSERSSSMPTPSTGRRTPYHHLEIKVAKLQEQLDNITSVPSNQELFEKTKTQYAEKPIGEMWMNMQLMSRVETNEKGIAKCMSMIEDMMKEMQSLKDANKSLMDKVKGLNLDDLMKRLKDLESKMNDVNDRFNLLPSPDDFAQFVTWAGLEDALSGIKKDWENMQQPTERVVIEMSSQTEAPSRPASSRPGTRMSSGSTGPSETLLEILEKLGRLSESHDSLTKRVEILEEELKNKLDKGALDNLNVSSDLLEQLQQLKQEVDALAAAREKLGGESVANTMYAVVKAAKKFKEKRRVSFMTESSEDSGLEAKEASSAELLLIQHEKELQAIAMESLQRRVETLEERLKLFQDMVMGDSAYQNNVSDPLEDIMSEGSSEQPSVEAITKISKEDEEEEKKSQTDFEQDMLDIFTKDPGHRDISDGSTVIVGDLVISNTKLRILAYVLNDQLHNVRDKIFTLDQELKKMAKGVEFALLRAKAAGMGEMDSDALGRAQAAIQQLQAEVEKLHGTTKDILEENSSRAKEIEKLFAYCDRLEENKADKEFVQTEMDVKADKRSLDNKVNHSLFDTTTNDINKMIKEILDKLAGNEEAWNHQCKVFTDDIEGKLDRLELDPLKEWLESRLKALNEKLKKQNQAPVEWSEDDAAGIRRQLIQKFHCISCDRPVDIVPTGPVPSLPTHNGLHPTRSPRPYTTFELDQIRQHAKSYANSEIADYYATTRSCGGQHTTTFPQKRITKLSHLSHLFREEEQSTNIYPLYKEEVDVQGADGNIYKGRMGRIEAKLPVMTKERSIVQRIDKSPQPMRQQITRVVRPVSAKHSPRPPSSKGGSRPQSAHPSASQQEVPANESSHTTPAPSQSPVPPEDIPQQQSIEIPAES